MLKTKRVYEAPSPNDGLRVLVDRIWPRGLSKDTARVDVWLKDLAPSTALRRWFGHDPARWHQFKQRYEREIKANRDATERLRELLTAHTTVTLLFGAADIEHNQAVVLREQFKGTRRRPPRKTAARRGPPPALTS
jgi:uncharacterized protein YeaO (DUF488 family)